MQEAVIDVAGAAVRCLMRGVPADVPRIAFLSGGQSGERASALLNAINDGFKSKLPWAYMFSFGRTIQQPGWEAWRIQCLNSKDMIMTKRIPQPIKFETGDIRLLKHDSSTNTLIRR